ncbi:MAG: LuxR family transcriptional regulator [Defluviimonas sp.]|nr:LuxR family transcriptional regulator [Paracoccaceae bacterium]MCC0062634.1 LuxR family transcriptional regulator [Defluviimonas sp.]
MKRRLAAFIDRLQDIGTLDDLQKLIAGLRSSYGTEHLVYHSVSSLGEQYAVLTYDARWVAQYVDNDYARIDPVVQGSLRRFHPVDWKQLDWTARRERDFLGEALEFGVGNQGYSVPIRGPNGQFAMFSVNDRASDRDWALFTEKYCADLILVGHYLNQKALEIERGSDVGPRHDLSPREIDVLSLLALGLNRAHAAESLAISEHTFRAYIETARQKLGAGNTLQAVARAVAAGYIRP